MSLDPSTVPLSGTRRTRVGERGTATAEYAVGTLGAAACGAALLAIARDPSFLELVERVLRTALDPGVLLRLLGDQPSFGPFHLR